MILISSFFSPPFHFCFCVGGERGDGTGRRVAGELGGGGGVIIKMHMIECSILGHSH